jgi:hypothetical protein
MKLSKAFRKRNFIAGKTKYVEVFKWVSYFKI